MGEVNLGVNRGVAEGEVRELGLELCPEGAGLAELLSGDEETELIDLGLELG